MLGPAFSADREQQLFSRARQPVINLGLLDKCRAPAPVDAFGALQQPAIADRDDSHPGSGCGLC